MKRFAIIAATIAVAAGAAAPVCSATYGTGVAAHAHTGH